MREDEAFKDVILAVSGLRKRFGATVALDGVQLSLRRREWLGLLGPNGAGKTTLVRAIVGRVRPNAGVVTLLGKPLSENGAAANQLRGNLGLVPQEIALFPLLTARENLQAFARFHGVEEAARKERVDWALAWAGLEEHARRPVKTFSGGMKRRLNLGCGVLHRPEVILLDEPTEGVDPQSRERIWKMLESLRQEGASLLHTTHHLHEAEEVCDRIVIIDGGKVAAAGTVDELVERTIGRSRRVVLTLDRPFSGPVALQVEPEEGRPQVVSCAVDDFSLQLPEVLDGLREQGYEVIDLHVHHPTLHAVFIHLTGRELRES